MPSTMFDSAVFRDAFGAPAMRAVFCDEATIARYVEVEVALAAAEASVGVIPKDAAAAIKRLARADAIDRRRAQGRDRSRRLPDRRHRAPARQAVRRGGALRALGRHHPGHHGQRHGAAAARGTAADRRRPGRARGRARRTGRQASRHGDGGAHAPAARLAGHLRLQGGRLARHDHPPPRAPGPARARACWSASSPARRARWPRSATRASPCTTR